MSTAHSPLPVHRSDLVIRPVGEDGRHVVKDPTSGAYFQIGAQEHFLLEQLDGLHPATAVCRAFEEKFAEPLSQEDLEGFLALARRKGLLQSVELNPGSAASEPAGSAASILGAAIRTPQVQQSILYWRKPFWDPDSFFTWLEPKIRLFWTPTFLFASAACIVLAIALFWANRFELVTAFRHALHWETVLLVWLTLFVVTMLHESAHGLTCK